jgi:hypothetical protein
MEDNTHNPGGRPSTAAIRKFIFMRKKSKIFLRIAFLAMVVCLSTGHPGQAADAEFCLELVDTGIGRIVHTTPMAAGSCFTLRYIHSVEKTPVFETYRINAAGDIYLQETTVKSSGYGLPTAETTGHYSFQNGWLRITDFNQKINPLIFRVSYLNDMLLIFDDHRVNLPAIAVPGHRIEVRIRCEK